MTTSPITSPAVSTGTGLETPPAPPAAPAPRPRLALALSDCRTLIGRQLRHLSRDPEQFIQTVSVPIVLLLLFRYLLGGAIRTGDGESYINYVVAGLIVISSGFSLTSTVVGVTDDLSNGIVERFRSMPVPALAPLVAHVVVAVLPGPGPAAAAPVRGPAAADRACVRA